MAELNHAARRLLRATYAPVRKQSNGRESTRGRYAVPKRAMAANLQVTQAELRMLEGQHTVSEGADGPDEWHAALAALATVADVADRHEGLDAAAAFADVEADALIKVVEALEELRRQEARDLERAQVDILNAYAEDRRQRGDERRRLGEIEVPAEARMVGITDDGAEIFEFETEGSDGETMPPPAPPPSLAGRTSGGSGGQRGKVVTARSVEAPSAGRMERESIIGTRRLLDWAVAHRVHSELATRSLQLMARRSVHASWTIADVAGVAWAQADLAAKIKVALRRMTEVEPVGFLHLERLSFVPAGIERGELVHSVPLSPNEEVNILHREWAHTSEEFSKIVTDYLEAISEEGVTEKSELAEAASAQEQHTSGFNTGVTASGGYGPVSITATAGYSVSSSESKSQQTARNHSMSLTRRASTRTKKEHKMSFRVTSAAGTEDQTARRIRNPFPDRATRVDYYQLIRKWRIDLHRYGIRLTYDLTIPEPGAEILSRIQEIRQIEAALGQGFGAPDANYPPAVFDLDPAEITREDYKDLAATFAAAVDPPPLEKIWVFKAEAPMLGSSPDEVEVGRFTRIDFEIPDDYAVAAVAGPAIYYWGWDEEEGFRFEHKTGTDQWIGKSGPMHSIMYTVYVASFSFQLRIRAELRPEAFARWQMASWERLREAARARYEENRQFLKQRLSTLTEQVGSDDALTLRKIEREEVMKGVLRWLFGPEFAFFPPGDDDLYAGDASVKSKGIWTKILSHGQLITFLHQAIEWENVLYFLYPYFWSQPGSDWEFKKYLDHPDPMHRAFLKSGSARVVLTIRPGFEKDFVTYLVSFLETGKPGAIPSDHPYMKITDEMEAYAKTNYPGIPSANAEGADLAEAGQLVGQWYEYTPTSALDIAFDEDTPTA